MPHLSYGMQQWFRDRGIEPSCGICEHFEDRGGPTDIAEGVCLHPIKPQGRVVKRGCCFNFARAVGGDDV